MVYGYILWYPELSCRQCSVNLPELKMLCAVLQATANNHPAALFNSIQVK
jgi:hypothetical protein